MERTPSMPTSKITDQVISTSALNHYFWLSESDIPKETYSATFTRKQSGNTNIEGIFKMQNGRALREIEHITTFFPEMPNNRSFTKRWVWAPQKTAFQSKRDDDKRKDIERQLWTIC